MRYTLYRRGNGHAYSLTLPDDLSARRAAAQTKDVLRVETDQGRVVWRRVPDDGPPGVEPWKNTPMDVDMVQWLDRPK